MSHPYTHAVSSAKLFGGEADDYIALHNWFDETKAWCPDMRHRSMRHHAEGIFQLESIFGVTIENSNGKAVPVRLIGEQHVREDLGFIPTAKDWLECMDQQKWMMFRDRAMNQRLREKPLEDLPESVADILSKQNMSVVSSHGDI